MKRIPLLDISVAYDSYTYDNYLTKLWGNYRHLNTKYKIISYKCLFNLRQTLSMWGK